VKLDRTSGGAIAGLEEGIIPIFPVERSFQIPMKTGKKAVTKTIKRWQLPMTQAYSFTDYRAQGQTILHVLFDISSPPTVHLTTFNAYVALSRSSGRDTIRLVRDFEDSLFTTPSCEILEAEDRKLVQLDQETELKQENTRMDM